MVIEAQKHLARYLGRLSTLVKMVKEGGAAHTHSPVAGGAGCGPAREGV